MNIHVERKYLSIDFFKSLEMFVILGIHNGYCTRYEFGDEKEHAIGLTICNLRILIHWKCKEDEDGEFWGC